MFSDSHHRCPHVTEQVSQLTEKVLPVTPIRSHVCSCDMGHCTCDNFTCDILEGLFYRRQTSHFKTLSTRLVHLLHSPDMSKDGMLKDCVSKAPATIPQNSSVLPNGSYLPNLVHTGCGTRLYSHFWGFPLLVFHVSWANHQNKTRLSVGFTSFCSKFHLVQATDIPLLKVPP